jgi:hypothetical protein
VPCFGIYVRCTRVSHFAKLKANIYMLPSTRLPFPLPVASASPPQPRLLCPSLYLLPLPLPLYLSPLPFPLPVASASPPLPLASASPLCLSRLPIQYTRNSLLCCLASLSALLNKVSYFYSSELFAPLLWFPLPPLLSHLLSGFLSSAAAWYLFSGCSISRLSPLTE